MIEDLPSPGEDFYRALQAEARSDAGMHELHILRAATSPAWGDLRPDERAIWSAAAARFLSE